MTWLHFICITSTKIQVVRRYYPGISLFVKSAVLASQELDEELVPSKCLVQLQLFHLTRSFVEYSQEYNGMRFLLE